MFCTTGSSSARNTRIPLQAKTSASRARDKFPAWPAEGHLRRDGGRHLRRDGGRHLRLPADAARRSSVRFRGSTARAPTIQSSSTRTNSLATSIGLSPCKLRRRTWDCRSDAAGADLLAVTRAGKADRREVVRQMDAASGQADAAADPWADPAAVAESSRQVGERAVDKLLPRLQ